MESQSYIATMSERFAQFASYMRFEHNIRDMRRIERSHVQQYADTLRERTENGTLSPATAQNYLSAVNRVLEIARGDRAMHVDPVREAGLPERRGIASTNKSVSAEQHQFALQSVSDRLGAQVALQRELGCALKNPARSTQQGRCPKPNAPAQSSLQTEPKVVEIGWFQLYVQNKWKLFE